MTINSAPVLQPIDGFHHVTAITADAAANVDFYARVLGLRLVKRTVNQDDPSVYHLYYADEHGSPGAVITFFEYPGAPRGLAGAGMVRSIVHRVGSSASLDFWEQRLREERRPIERDGDGIRFTDPDGMAHELSASPSGDAPLTARSSQIPAEHSLAGIDGVRALVSDPARSAALLGELPGFSERRPGEWQARGARRHGWIGFEASDRPGTPGAGTVHHVAWSTRSAEQERWRELIGALGLRPTAVIDRLYFRSVYFREPGGILYELATLDGAGFAVDEPAETMGQSLSLPRGLEPLREQLERTLHPLPDTVRWRAVSGGGI